MSSKSRRPFTFIGSSAEGLSVAEHLQLALDHECEVKVWHQGVFGLGGGTLEELVNLAPKVDFAILVLTPDDTTTSRNQISPSPRDNVIFELGLFVGVLGPRRTFIVHDRTANLKLPSDLAGITTATFQPHDIGDLTSTLGAPTTQIKTAIRKLGLRTQLPIAAPGGVEDTDILTSIQGAQLIEIWGTYSQTTARAARYSGQPHCVPWSYFASLGEIVRHIGPTLLSAESDEASLQQILAIWCAMSENHNVRLAWIDRESWDKIKVLLYALNIVKFGNNGQWALTEQGRIAVVTLIAGA
jgi:hypothetical protein